MIYLAILWAVVGIVSSAVDFYRGGVDLTIGDVVVAALAGPIVTLAMTRVFDIVILRRKK